MYWSLKKLLPDQITLGNVSLSLCPGNPKGGFERLSQETLILKLGVFPEPFLPILCI